MIAAGIYYLHSKQLLLRKSNANGVAFENPSYLREVNMETIQVLVGTCCQGYDSYSKIVIMISLNSKLARIRTWVMALQTV